MGLNGPSSGVTLSLPEQILLQVCRIRAPCDSASEITSHSGQINPLNIIRPSAAQRCFLAVRQRPVGSQRNSRRRRDLLSFTPRQRRFSFESDALCRSREKRSPSRSSQARGGCKACAVHFGAEDGAACRCSGRFAAQSRREVTRKACCRSRKEKLFFINLFSCKSPLWKAAQQNKIQF